MPGSEAIGAFCILYDKIILGFKGVSIISEGHMAGRKRKLRIDRIILLCAIVAAVFAGGFGLAKLLDSAVNNDHYVRLQPSAHKRNTEEGYSPVISETQATLFMVGDALLHDTVYNDGRTADGGWDFTHQIHRLGEIARQYDLAYYNQETILGGEELGLSNYPMFCSPQEWGRDMVAQGFNLVSTATNHALDRWGAGIAASKAFWKSQEGVVEDGTNTSWEEYNELPVYEVNGISYVFVSWTYGMNGLQCPEGEEYLVNCYDGYMDVMLDQVRQGKEKADVVIVAIHWGDEYSMTPNESQMSIARQLSDAGADIIIGNHVHCIQPIEWINGKTICFYALGNMISDQWPWEESMIGMMGALKITKTVQGSKTDIKISDVKADLHWTYSNRPAHTDFEAIPFSQLNDSLYPGYEEVYSRYVTKITEMDDSIQVGGF